VRNRRLPLILALIGLLTVTPAALGAFGRSFKPVKGNPANKLVDVPIDDYKYDYAKRCLRRTQKGTRALESWLGRHAGGVTWGTERCERWGRGRASLHAEGRALDWHLDARIPLQKRQGERLINLLLAPDKAGNAHALARRMGIQEIIWNCRSWYTGSDHLERYSVCYDRKGRRRRNVDPTTAHKDHIHFGLNWRGARKKTSFWRSRLARR
jgi:hypothetical protein